MSRYNNQQSTINVLNTLMQCSYPPNFRDFISNTIIELSNTKGTQFYKVNRTRGNVTDTIIVVKYMIQTIFSLKTYDIPILIYINKSYPYEAPEIYLERSPETGVNPKNIDIDSNTYRITTPGLKSWNQFSTIPTILTEITNSFNKSFPIYKLSKKQDMPMNDFSQVNQFSQVNFGQTNVNQPGLQNPMYQQVNQPPIYQQPIQQQNQPNTIYNQLGIGGQNPNPYQQSDYGNYQQPTKVIETNTIYKPQQNESPEEGIKRILIEEIIASIDPKIKEEVKRLKQQEEKLKNYKNEFQMQIEKYQKVIGSSDNIQNEFQNTLKNCELEINSLKTYLLENSGKEITSQNFGNFIRIGNQEILRVVSIEATIEDLIAIIKKAYQKEILSFDESVKIIRNITREATKIKYYREKLTKRVMG